MMNKKSYLTLILSVIFISFSNCDSNREVEEQIITQEEQEENNPIEEEEETSDTFVVGELGPSGGYVFYDKGEYTDGWRYIEATISDFENVQWGCFNQPIVNARNLGIGTGLQNSLAIINFHDGLNDYYNNPKVCDSYNDGSVAAKLCVDLVIGDFDNWHLPSEEEMLLIYENLYLKGLGDFSAENLYWTSSEHDDNTATAIDFFNTNQQWGWSPKQIGVKVRAVRYF